MFKKFLIVLMSLLFSIISVTTVFAEKVEKESVVGFSVNAILPDNQLNKDVTYFDLLMKSDQKQTVEIKLFNTSDEDIKVKTSVHNAETNRNGLIDYSNDIEPIDSSLKIPLSSIMKLKQNEIIIPKGKQQTIETEINMPKRSFEGVILGGIRFEKASVSNEEEKEDSSVQIKNKYAYVIGVQLRQTDKKVQPELNLVDVEPTLVNYRTSVIAKIQNKQSAIVGDLTVDGKVYEEKGNKVLHEAQKDNLKMAPNSTMEYVIDWDNERLEPGKYRLELKAESEEETWKWKEYFEIKSDAAKDVNKEAVDLDEGDNKLIWIISGVAVFIILILLIIILRMKKKQRKNSDTPEGTEVDE